MESEGKIAIVDPGDATPIHEYIKKTGFKLTEVLITHHHWDHTGGLEEVVAEYNCSVYGPSGGHIKGISNLVSMLEKNGILYISFPIGKTDEVHFNAHRVFHTKSILKNHLQCNTNRKIQY